MSRLKVLITSVVALTIAWTCINSKLVFASSRYLAQADPPDGDKLHQQLPGCASMPDAQVPGTIPGSACRVKIVAPVGISMPSSVDEYYRSGSTHHNTSDSGSDLAEDQIKVEGFLYYLLSGTYYYDDQCSDNHYDSSHASCSTIPIGFSQWRQNGYHYFWNSVYGNDNFSTNDYWSV
jgi:hypothetical protein